MDGNYIAMKNDEVITEIIEILYALLMEHNKQEEVLWKIQDLRARWNT